MPRLPQEQGADLRGVTARLKGRKLEDQHQPGNKSTNKKLKLGLHQGSMENRLRVDVKQAKGWGAAHVTHPGGSSRTSQLLAAFADLRKLMLHSAGWWEMSCMY